VFDTHVLTNWEAINKMMRVTDQRWVFRGQPKDELLASSLERACKDAAVDPRHRQRIESGLVLDFQRRCDTADRNLVRDDTMYCMALMQHHGAPTRLLDWTYSAYVGAFFALDGETVNPTLWALNTTWCRETASGIDPRIRERDGSKKRTEESFRACYLAEPRRFVLPENAFALNARATVQQGVFLCPGDVGSTFEENIQALAGWQDGNSVRKFVLNFAAAEKAQALRSLYRMNISQASLFPGLDGFAKSLRQRMLFHTEELTADQGNA
jgi:hypothetical protein